MIPWKEIDRADIPGQKKESLTLRKRGSEYSIRTSDTELMNSRLHGSEKALATLACDRVCHRSENSNLTILIGGLGMGFTLAAAIEHSNPDTRITVSELIPAVVTWNREHLGQLAGMPLDNPKVTIKIEDVIKTIGNKMSVWDIILLDVDNGPDGLTRKSNDRLYTRAGLKKIFHSLRTGGILGIWSSKGDDAFTHRLTKSGFGVDTQTVSARESGRNSRHTIWFAQKP